MMRRARAVAQANIALAKYWGKLPGPGNFPAVPSLSVTLEALRSTTDIGFDDGLERDEVWLNGVPAEHRALERVVRLLDEVRTRAGLRQRAQVRSDNDFPTAAGLASSASGFAALALAALAAAGQDPSPSEVSALARAQSASAARSAFGGYVALRAGAASAELVLPAEDFPLEMLVALTVPGPKALGSSEGMRLTAESSPYFTAWLEAAPRLYEELYAGVLSRDLDAIGPPMEQSALAMHASMLAARPGIVYFAPATLAVIERVRRLRADGACAYFTIDAGPHVKVLTLSALAAELERELSRVPGVSGVVRSRLGPGARLLEP